MGFNFSAIPDSPVFPAILAAAERLLGRDQRELAVNDDVGSLAPEGFSARDAVLEFALSGPGTYTIEATRFGGRGEYVLTLEKAEG